MKMIKVSEFRKVEQEKLTTQRTEAKKWKTDEMPVWFISYTEERHNESEKRCAEVMKLEKIDVMKNLIDIRK